MTGEFIPTCDPATPAQPLNRRSSWIVTFLQALAAPGAAIVAPIDLVTADANAGTGDIPIRRVAAAWGELHD